MGILLNRFFSTVLTLAALSLPTQLATAQTPEPKIGGPYDLINHHGTPVSEKTFLGTFQIVTFGYTYCPDVCPVTLATLADILELLDGDVDKVQPIFITLDPKRDGPEQLAGYVEHFHPKIIGLTGSLAQVKKVADAYQVQFRQSEPDADGDYLLEHSAVHYLIDANGDYLGHMEFDVLPEAAAQAVKAMLSASGS